MPDYIPSSDAEFDDWLDNFTQTLSQIHGHDQDGTLATAHTNWTTTFADYKTKKAASEAARQAKDEARQTLEAAVRTRTRAVQADADVSNATRAALRLNISDGRRTPAAAPTTRPVATIDTSQSLRHTIEFFDEQTPNSRRKPDGVRGCEIWVKIGDAAPADPAEMRFLALDSATPYIAEYDGADAGKTAHYRLRWSSTRGEVGPWSQLVNATITS
jgi:hypothetical protein